jgi:uncharacterized protein
MKFGLKEEVMEKINRIFSRYERIEKVIIYGSRAKGNYKTGSDIDLTMMGEDLTLSYRCKIELELDDLLLPYTFDISIFDEISSPKLIDHINRVGALFYIKKRVCG